MLKTRNTLLLLMMALGLGLLPACSSDDPVGPTTESFDAVAYFSGEKEPLTSRVHVRCGVGSPPVTSR